ncbi:MAG: NAD-dependent epimerase/dehydratase family protein [Elusimicrobia bacterium]|nr:NAD-dependent epimerase/dehydratase family protein [Elusimicrobiota bacterium]
MSNKERSFKGKSIIVTGGSGFVGRSLVRRLKDEEGKVLVLDKKNGFDLCNQKKFSSLKKLRNVDCIYHLAAVSFVPYAWKNPRDTYYVNLTSTLNVLEFCRKMEIKKLVFMSSYVYGQPEYLPVDESHPVLPANPYAGSKRISEQLCEAYSRDFGIRCVILRPFNIYGLGQDKRFLIPDIIKQIINNRKVVLNDSRPKRDLLYLDDMTEALLKAGRYNPVSCEIFNIGYGKSYSVKAVVEYAEKVWGRKISILYRNIHRKNEIMDIYADISHAKKKLTWEPKIGLKEGLEKMFTAIGLVPKRM